MVSEEQAQVSGKEPTECAAEIIFRSCAFQSICFLIDVLRKGGGAYWRIPRRRIRALERWWVGREGIQQVRRGDKTEVGRKPPFRWRGGNQAARSGDSSPSSMRICQRGHLVCPASPPTHSLRESRQTEMAICAIETSGRTPPGRGKSQR